VDSGIIKIYWVKYYDVNRQFSMSYSVDIYGLYKSPSVKEDSDIWDAWMVSISSWIGMP